MSLLKIASALEAKLAQHIPKPPDTEPYSEPAMKPAVHYPEWVWDSYDKRPRWAAEATIDEWASNLHGAVDLVQGKVKKDAPAMGLRDLTNRFETKLASELTSLAQAAPTSVTQKINALVAPLKLSVSSIEWGALPKVVLSGSKADYPLHKQEQDLVARIKPRVMAIAQEHQKAGVAVSVQLV